MVHIRWLAAPAFALLMPLAAAAQPAAPGWRDRLPALALDGPVTPLDAPRAVGGRAWSGFSRLCTEDRILQPGGEATLTTAPRCIAITAAADGIAARLGMRVEGVSPGATIRLRRDAEGAVQGVDVEPDAGLPPVTPQRRAALLDAFARMLTALTVTPRQLGAGDRFTPPAAPEPALDGGQAEHHLACTIGGRATYRGRDVLVADCAGVFDGELLPGSAARMEILMRVAVEESTGLLALQTGVTRTAMRSRQGEGWREDGVAVTLRKASFE
ncbi:MAG TPA: hypothetical protein VGM87_17825 [Roseomonas sp.]|jgi:hypothetical protein